MSITRRLFNIARAEIRSVFRTSERLTPAEQAALEAEIRAEEERRRAERWKARGDRDAESAAAAPDGDVPVEISRYYANLELHVGANAAEVRAAYRRLIRRYHPDVHHGDDDKARVANELTQRLRTAHDKLLEHLERRTT
jgi:DnaJ-domain-containing protein 1